MSEPPSVFISYSWTTPDHEAWVLQLANDLSQSGVHPVLDKWDLREGEDPALFMERMVNDPGIHKVILVCDRKYKEKADARTGGAGTEAQIISPALYGAGEKRNTKFVAVLAEKNENGGGFVPTYYGGRIYIDLSDESERSERFEQLVRWVFDKPVHVRPAIGARPAFLEETEGLQLQTSIKARRTTDAIRSHKPFWAAALREYLEALCCGLEQLRLSGSQDNFEDLVSASIKSFVPYRNEYLEVIRVVAQHNPGSDGPEVIHRFIESILPYSVAPSGLMSHTRWQFDNFCFLIYEMYLLTVAIFLKAEIFEYARVLVQQDYFGERLSYSGNRNMHAFTRINRMDLGSFQRTMQKLGLRTNSMRAHVLVERIPATGLQLTDVMQADLTLALAGRAREDSQVRWWPDTLLYSQYNQGAFPIFARSSSRAYYAKVQPIIGMSGSDLVDAVAALDEQGGFFSGMMVFGSERVATLIGSEALCTRP